MLWGWKPTETTEHEYEDGLLVRSVTTRESEWDEEQIDLLLAVDAFKADLGSHGHLMSEATNPGADPTEYDTPYAYVGHGPFTDWAEKARLDRIDAYKLEAGEKANLNGMYFTVEKQDYT